VRSPGQAVNLHVQHAVGDIGHHLPEEIVVRALLNEASRSFCRSSWFALLVACGVATRASLDSDHDQFPARRRCGRPGKKLRRGYSPVGLEPPSPTPSPSPPTPRPGTRRCPVTEPRKGASVPGTDCRVVAQVCLLCSSHSWPREATPEPHSEASNLAQLRLLRGCGLGLKDTNDAFRATFAVDFSGDVVGGVRGRSKLIDCVHSTILSRSGLVPFIDREKVSRRPQNWLAWLLRLLAKVADLLSKKAQTHHCHEAHRDVNCGRLQQTQGLRCCSAG
jgi:hypothetical protein